jgi:hypothetical protein
MRVRGTLFVLVAGWMAFSLTAVQAAELIMFETTGCVWCAKWREEVGPGYAKSLEGQRAPLRTHRVEAANTAGIMLAAPVVISPTFVLTDNGREVGRITGYPGQDFFWGFLQNLLTKLDKATALPGQRAEHVGQRAQR